eukprot:TRINITY_DN6233_c0_g1_i1.p1 TRINITY_DN6233_c0_g1~~TRINITY_DN6233_c0_g1_i1.p1  ORF type:complete len:1181 (-),score=328.05 TRINITY_DN6233_c0_g1_i1:96-3638(-)
MAKDKKEKKETKDGGNEEGAEKEKKEKKEKKEETPEEKAQREEKKRLKKEKSDPADWDLHGFPKMEDREIVQAKVDPERKAEMHEEAMKKIEANKGEDPATFKRKWKLNFSIMGMENFTASALEVFLAISQVPTADRASKSQKRIKSKFNFTKSYRIGAMSRKRFRAEELVYAKSFEASYEEITHKEIVMDMWSVSTDNFNILLGTAYKTLYDLGNCSIYQTIPVWQAGEDCLIATIHVKAVMTEIFEFSIRATNWSFNEKAEFQRNPYEEKKMRMGIPTGPQQGSETNETKFIKGPQYCWPSAGEFTYTGTLCSLSQEAITVAIFTHQGCQGKALVSLASAGDYPIAQGPLKKICQNRSEFVQGTVVGNLTVETRSVLLEPGTLDEDSSIPPPWQPADTLVTFYLNPKIQYLVVDLSTADGLPIADVDRGTSNPFARVKFDGMVQQSPHVDSSLSPVWNHTFYFPVRVTEESIRTKEELYKNILPVEMQSKGYLEIEVWHMDGVPTEFLGELKLDLSRTRFGVDSERAICDKVTKARTQNVKRGAEAAESLEQGDGEGDISMGISPGLAKRHKTKVFEARREKLSGSWLQAATKSSVTFECYFVPDFPDNFRYLEQENNMKDENGASPFSSCFSRWEDHWAHFKDAYKAWFPDSCENRRYLNKYTTSAGDELPLVNLVMPLALPASLEEPQMVLHWVRCMEFTVPPRQRSLGQMSNWATVDSILSLRKGTVQDHAIILCCALMGLRKDAFVCKGTLQGGKEHAWVMTREDGGCVTFWEATTGCKYHLPSRWINDREHGAKAKKEAADRWAARKANPKWLELAGKRASMNRMQHIQYLDDLPKLPISPWKELYNGDQLVVTPYDTIEVVFNGRQLWGNKSNADPSCIYYDMEDDPQSWFPLILEEKRYLLREGQGAVIPVGPALSTFTAECMEHNAEAELKECIRMVRTRSGHETYFVDDPLLQDTLVTYLEFLENETRLDADWCHDPSDKQRRPWSVGSPFNNQMYVQKCRQDWAEHWKKKKQLEVDKLSLPVKPNYILSGLPLHFSSSDLKEIRYHLMNCEPLQEYLTLPKDEILYFVRAKMFPMPSSVSSTWIFLGAQMPLSDEEVMEIAHAQMKEFNEKGEEGSEMDDDEALKAAKVKSKKKAGLLAVNGRSPDALRGSYASGMSGETYNNVRPTE